MTKKSSTPAIRFKGFTDTWEQRKLGDNIIEYTETTTKNNQYPPLTSSRKGIFLQTEYFAGNQIASDDNTGYNIVPYGYFTYRHMSDDEIFHFNINDIVENGIVSTLYPVFTTDENLDSRYLQYQLNYGYEFAKFAILQKQGGSRTYMYLNKLKQLYLTMPKSVEEQNAISAFFMSLDHLITLHQRKYDKLTNVKKSMLEKMFPKNGSNVPEIRFKGFTEAWEQRKVSELFRVTRGYVLAATQTETTKTDEKPYPVYSSQTKDKGLMGYYKDYLYEDAITWTTDGANAGTVNYRAGKFYCTNVCGVLLSNEVKANQMIAEALNSVAKGYVSYVGNPKLMNNVMADIVIQIPTQAEEREQLSSFFAKLDNLITLHQRELEKLKNLKKACLEKMFV